MLALIAEMAPSLIVCVVAICSFAMLWHTAGLLLKSTIWVIRMTAFTIARAPAAYAAAKAERTLPARDMSTGFLGHRGRSKAFNAIAHDRLMHSRLAYRDPRMAEFAARFGRWLASR